MQNLNEDAVKYIHTLEEKLKIAVDGLKEYAEIGNWDDCFYWNDYLDDFAMVKCAQFGENGYTIAQETLDKIRNDL